LRGDVLTSTNEGLKGERDHLTIELKETRQLQSSYEEKCAELNQELTTTTAEYRELKRQQVGHTEEKREREERIEQLKKALYEIKDAFDKLELSNGTLKIEHAKILDLYETSRKNLEDTTSKLHMTNKVRHETEVQLGD